MLFHGEQYYMFHIQRLNTDNSWSIRWNDVSFLLDPWIIGPEIDGFPAFNIQWHVIPPVHRRDIPEPDFMIVSQPYSDHCHEESLHLFDVSVPVAGPKQVRKRLSGKVPQQVQVIPGIGGEPLRISGIELYDLRPPRLIDPVYHATVILSGSNYILYAPHGYVLRDNEREFLSSYQCLALITTFTDYRLPFFLGGKINLGENSAVLLVEQLRPAYVFSTHDTPKIAKGVVTKMSRARYPDFSKITFPAYAQFVDLPGYDVFTLPATGV